MEKDAAMIALCLCHTAHDSRDLYSYIHLAPSPGEMHGRILFLGLLVASYIPMFPALPGLSAMVVNGGTEPEIR